MNNFSGLPRMTDEENRDPDRIQGEDPPIALVLKAALQRVHSKLASFDATVAQLGTDIDVGTSVHTRLLDFQIRILSTIAELEGTRCSTLSSFRRF